MDLHVYLQETYLRVGFREVRVLETSRIRHRSTVFEFASDGWSKLCPTGNAPGCLRKQRDCRICEECIQPSRARSSQSFLCLPIT